MKCGPGGQWSAPFAKRVIESWAAASKANGWDKVAEEVKKNILAQSKK